LSSGSSKDRFRDTVLSQPAESAPAAFTQLRASEPGLRTPFAGSAKVIPLPLVTPAPAPSAPSPRPELGPRADYTPKRRLRSELPKLPVDPPIPTSMAEVESQTEIFREMLIAGMNAGNSTRRTIAEAQRTVTRSAHDRIVAAKAIACARIQHETTTFEAERKRIVREANAKFWAFREPDDPGTG
jgi:hypothetical protein